MARLRVAGMLCGQEIERLPARVGSTPLELRSQASSCWHLLCVIPCTPQSAEVGAPARECWQTCHLPVLQRVRLASWRLVWHWDTVPFTSFANTWSSEVDDSESYEVPSSKAGVLGKMRVLS